MGTFVLWFTDEFLGQESGFLNDSSLNPSADFLNEVTACN